MGTASEQLSAFAEQLQFKDIPSKVIERVKLHILDILGIGLAASDMDFAQRVSTRPIHSRTSYGRSSRPSS